MQNKSDMMDNFRRLESELNFAKSQNERIFNQKNQIEKELKTCLNKSIQFEKTIKETMLFIFLIQKKKI